MKLPIYLDYSATTPVDPRVAQKMSECLLVDGNFGNPASRSHVFGWKAEEAVENARRQVADLVNADPREIVWTSGATEVRQPGDQGCCAFLCHQRQAPDHHQDRAQGGPRHHAPAGARRLRSDLHRAGHRRSGDAGHGRSGACVMTPSWFPIMHVNNEIGTINDIAAIGELTRSARRVVACRCGPVHRQGRNRPGRS